MCFSIGRKFDVTENTRFSAHFYRNPAIVADFGAHRGEFLAALK
jgi:hypothetical protein